MANFMEGSLDKATTEKILSSYQKDHSNAVLRHALSRGTIANAVFEPMGQTQTTLTFNTEIKTMPVTNQKASGRCWIFAALNVLRESIAKKLGTANFELSENYISLYDKIEKANFALESVIQLCQYSPNERVFMHILSCPVSDGGQWDMFVNLVKKYGLMPKDCFPETFQSENTAQLNFIVNAAIRNFAYQAHGFAKKGRTSQIRELKERTMEKIYGLYLNAFGVPPKDFEFSYLDSKEKYHKERFTPKTFFSKFVGAEIDEYQSLINSPTEDKPFNKNYTVDFLGNVLEGKAINHLNLEMKELVAAVIRQLKAGEPVWFGSDVAFYRDRDSFAWDDRAFAYEDSLGIPIDFDKGAMLDFRHSAMNHAMVIVGVELDGEKPLKWKIENSWGESVGAKGYYVMSDSWFEKFVYQAVVKTKYLKKEHVTACKKAPTHLNPWDPMGTLAD
ncbi:MAG: C1 family peptidase [Bacilli bacterium]|nr:C1 family peptidase [Bacilli bacterium]